MIEIRDLGVYYGAEKALDGIHLQIAENTTCAIIGPSGCGKTTLIHALAGLVQPQEGEILVHGERLKSIRKGTGVVFQNFGLLPWKTAWENVAVGLRVRKEEKDLIDRRVQSIFERLGIGPTAGKYPIELSGGQKQRVAIGRALALQPDLLLMDEPSSALDAISKEHIQDLVLGIYKENPMTLVLVTHSIDEAVFLGQKIVVMGKAKIRHILDNPYFGDEHLREKLDSYRICLEVRRWMAEEGGEPQHA